MTFNRVMLAGRLTRDVSLTLSPGARRPIARTAIAINRRSRSASGDTVDEVTFVELETYDEVAKRLSRSACKGWTILVEGYLRLDRWKDKVSGAARACHRVIVETFEPLGTPVGAK